MANTPNGLPYPLASDDLRQGAAAIESLATAMDPRALSIDSLDLAGTLVSPVTSGTLFLRVKGKRVELVGNLSGSFAAGAASITASGAIPEAYRPNALRPGAAFFSAGSYLGGAYAGSSGVVGYYVRDVPSARTGMQFSILWTV